MREHALVIGEVVLTSGRTAQYLVDAKRAILRPAGFLALAELVAAQAGLGRDRRRRYDDGRRPDRLRGARRRRRRQGLLRSQRGRATRPRAPDRGPGLDAQDRCMLVEDVVTTGGSTIRALEALREEGRAGLRRARDLRPSGRRRRGDRAGRGVLFVSLTTLDDIYPRASGPLACLAGVRPGSGRAGLPGKRRIDRVDARDGRHPLSLRPVFRSHIATLVARFPVSADSVSIVGTDSLAPVGGASVGL